MKIISTNRTVDLCKFRRDLVAVSKWMSEKTMRIQTVNEMLVFIGEEMMETQNANSEHHSSNGTDNSRTSVRG